MNTAQGYRLAPGVALRPERFGALVYRYDNRRLYFIHSREAADFVRGLDGAEPLTRAVETFVADRALPKAVEATLLDTVGKLETIGLLSADAAA